MSAWKRLFPVILVTAITVMISCMLYHQMAEHEIQRGKMELEISAQNVTRQIHSKFEDEITKLHMVEEMLLQNELFYAESSAVLNLNEFQPTTIFSRIDILYPDGTIVRNGEIQPLKENVDFTSIIQKGEYMTQRKTDSISGIECVYYVLPIMDGDTLRATLIAMVDAGKLQEIFQPNIYGGKANICLVDAKDGNYIMDSWHRELVNVHDVDNRKMLKGYDGIDPIAELTSLKTGLVGFESQTSKKPMYLYYTPLGLFDWQLSIFAEGDVLFYELAHLRQVALYAGCGELLILLFYFLWNRHIILCLVSALQEVEAQKKELRFISYRDMLTGLYNRNKYLEMEETLGERQNFGVVYLDLNRLKEINDTQSHEAGDRYIRDAARVLQSVFADNCYRIGGDEFVVLAEEMPEDAFREKIAALQAKMLQAAVSISIGTAWLASCPEPMQLLKKAEMQMYAEKKRYHIAHDRRKDS